MSEIKPTLAEKFQRALGLATKLQKFSAVEPVVVKFEAFKVKESDVLIEYGSLEKGAEVRESSPSGSVAAKDGVYSLENGVDLTVKDGKIEEFKQPTEDVVNIDAKVDEKVAEKMAEVIKTFNTMSEQFTAMSTKVTAAMESFSKLPTVAQLEEFKTIAAEFKTEASQVGEIVQILATLPTEFSKSHADDSPKNEVDKVKQGYENIGAHLDKKAAK